jgi:hypothetical protein
MDGTRWTERTSGMDRTGGTGKTAGGTAKGLGGTIWGDHRGLCVHPAFVNYLDLRSYQEWNAVSGYLDWIGRGRLTKGHSLIVTTKSTRHTHDRLAWSFSSSRTLRGERNADERTPSGGTVQCLNYAGVSHPMISQCLEHWSHLRVTRRC